MPVKRSPVTIQDVAKAAGVSVSTVSRVLNERADVASDTREHILSIIDDLGYTSNLAARSMRSHKKNLIGLVVPDIGFPYSIEIMKGINQAVAESSFDLLLYTTGQIRKVGTITREQHYVSLLNNSLTDGVIIVASAAAEFITDAPIIAVDPHLINPNYTSVQGTNYQGALEAMDYLLGLGHRRIAFICGRPEIGSAVRRLKGYRDALFHAGVELDEDLIVPGDFSTETGYERALHLLAMADPPTAIFASNDQTAIGVFQAADELGLSIPGDLSVIGFDNITEAKYFDLTTIDQGLSQMGYVATQMLIKLISNDPLDVQVYKMPTKLIERSSCQALAKKVGARRLAQ
ncbi:MAG: LacI family DNA-binding transcriptional regulator [Anaerolineales bacterium]|nr:LacI family DNA-binding transcriptional regulator [Anaerolineales bacterium]